MKKLTITETQSARGGFALALVAGLILAPAAIVGGAVGATNAS